MQLHAATLDRCARYSVQLMLTFTEAGAQILGVGVLTPENM